MKYKKFLLLMLTAIMVLGFAGTSFAAFSAAGPIDPGLTVPSFYQDGAGLALTPCLTQNIANPLANQFCVLITDCAPGQVPPACFNASQPISMGTNFPVEAFYWVADNVFNAGVGGAAKVKLRMALEASSFTGVYPITPNSLITFLRVNLARLSGLTPNSTYTFTYPFGTFQVITDATGNVIPQTLANAAFRSQDGCGGVPCDYTLVLPATNTHLGPFLKCTTAPFTDPATGKQYIGTPLVPCDITPGPFGNFVRIDGPNVGGTGINTITSPAANWRVAGEIFAGVLPTPLIFDRSTYSCALGAPSTGQVDVFANSAPTALLSASGAPNLPALPQPMIGDGLGNFFTHLPLTPDASVIPLTISVSASNVGNTPTTLSTNLVDIVKINSAIYDMTLGTLTINAVSSDQCSPVPPVLTAVGFGNLLAGTLSVPGVVAPPPFITVTSSKGGIDIVDTNITASGAGATLSISGTILNGATPMAGVTVTLSGAAARVVTTDAAGAYSFVSLVPGSYSVTPSSATFTFTPVSAPVTLTVANVTQNFAGAPKPVINVSGTVLTQVTALPVAGVTMTLTGGPAPITTTTLASGAYSFLNVPAGTYALTAVLPGVAITPASIPITGTTAAANFTAAFTAFTVSGSVTAVGTATGIGGVSMSLTGTNALGAAVIAPATTALNGTYTFTGVINGTYTVTPSKPPLVFTPAVSAPITIAGASVAGINFTAPTFAISGTVKSTLGAALPGVTVNLTGAATATVTTDLNGAYAFAGLASGNYTVTPVLAGLTFSPLSAAVTIIGSDVLNVNFTSPVFTISGTVKNGRGLPVPGVTITVTATGINRVVTTDANGNYAVGLLGNGVYKVTPTLTGHLFNPASLTVTISNSDRNGQNFTMFF